MKKTKKTPLWYNPVEKDRRDDLLRRSGLTGAAASQEGRALLESYCRIYRLKL